MNEKEEIKVTDIIKVEKNLESLGFFVPSSNVIKNKWKKESKLTLRYEGKKIEVRYIIRSNPDYGLPITKDFDMYRAFQYLLHSIIKETGKIENPISFKTNQLINLMGKKKQRSQELYRDVEKWLKKMTNVTIEGGVVYQAGKKCYLDDIFHVFDRVKIYGEKLESGEVASKNYVWLGDWYLENLNLYYLKYIDFDYHKSLRKPLSKNLYAILDVGFYANRSSYSKSYKELCSFLSIKEFKGISRIRQQLDPAHKELKEKNEFLSSWKYEKNKSGDIIITWFPGEKYFSDQKLRIERKQIALDFKVIEHDEKESPSAIELIKYFQYKKNDLNNYEPKKSELKRAEEVIKECGDLSKSKMIVDYAITEMNNTNFKAKYFGAVCNYVEFGLKVIERSQQIIEIDKKKKNCLKCKGTGFILRNDIAILCSHK